MRHMVCMGLLLLGVVVATAAAKDEGDVEGTPVTTFSGVPLTVTTNAQGGVSEASFRASSKSTYLLDLKTMKPAVLKELLRLHDRLVELKGEVSQVEDKLMVKVVGAIEDITPSLQGGTLLVTMERKTKRVTGVSYKVEAFKYTVVTNGMPVSLIRSLEAMDNKTVSIDGKLSQLKMCISGVRSIRPSGGGDKPKDSKKKGK